MQTTPSDGDGSDNAAAVMFGVTLTLVLLPVIVACLVLTFVTGSEALRLVGSGSAAVTTRFATAFGLLVLATTALVASIWGALRSYRRGEHLLRSLRWPLLALPLVALGMLATVWAVQP